MSDLYQKSVDLHRQHQGKLSIKSKVKVETREDLSLAYTPGVAEVSRRLAQDPAEARNLSLKGNTVAVVSDGSAILGLGNLGPVAAIPVMEGKSILFKEFAGVDAFPICLDTQDTEEIIKTVKNIAPVFGGINLEDISAPRCFEIEKRLQEELDIPVLNDDQHGTATVVLAGLINALKLRGSQKEEVKIVINGSGSAGVAITKFLYNFGFKDIIVCDSRGIIYSGRDNLNPTKVELATFTNQEGLEGDLAQALQGRDIFIGVSAPNILSAEMIKTMNDKAIIFALANPVPEVDPDLAKSAGAYIVATGRSDYPNQLNNVLAFPGIFRGALDNKVKQITTEMLIKAAQILADLVPNPDPEHILPNPLNKEIAPQLAKAIS